MNRKYIVMISYWLFVASLPAYNSNLDTLSTENNRDTVQISRTEHQVPYLKHGRCIGIVAFATIIVVFVVVAATLIPGQFDNPLHGEM